MKKLLSLLLIAALLITALALFPASASAEAAFQEGDTLYLRIQSPEGWVQDCLLYANFTAFSRADNGGHSVTIADADPARYAPVQGVAYDSDRGLYRCTVTAADAGATAMRFWRGTAEKLWNCSVALTAEDYAAGRNTVVVTDWTDAGYLEASYAFDLQAKLGLSAARGEAGEPFDITVSYEAPESAKVVCDLRINDKSLGDLLNYTFTPESSGVYAVQALLTATDPDSGEVLSTATVSGMITVGLTAVHAVAPNALYAHAARGSKDTEAWVRWYSVDGVYYLFLPSSVKKGEPVELFSTYSEETTLDTLTVEANGLFDFTPEEDTDYVFRQGRTTRCVRFLYSSAESALFVNNTDDFDGVDFFSYLKADKEHSVSASAAYTHPNGTVSDVEVKKMKGRGNTSWNAEKKGFNVTFKDAITLDGMQKCKKFSLISNFQDASLLRNRILFDLADAVGVPYASDSRMIDLYTNGVYQGSYQLCEKVDVGKNSLMPDIDDEDYLDKETGGVKADFSFVAEIDSSPAADDFHFTVANGNNLTMKSPELDADDPNTAAVRSYITGKFNVMFARLQNKAEDIGDYIDLDSLAKVYLINELGKNWDSGASSFFLTYKPDDNGRYKFFASPVWDYDNSLGNANGIDSDLRRMGATDYTLPTGWFATKKNGYNGPNFLATAAKHSAVMECVYTVWFESFVPALEILAGTGVSDGEMYSADVYYAAVRDSAAMNYKIWPIETDTEWIADHSALQCYSADYTYNDYGQVTGVTVEPMSSVTAYDQDTYDGQFAYLIDWTLSRAAWISGEYIAHYHPLRPYVPGEDVFGDVNLNGEVDILDATLIQRYLVSLEDLSERQLSVGDTTRSGYIDIMDATFIQRCLAGLQEL